MHISSSTKTALIVMLLLLLISLGTFLGGLFYLNSMNEGIVELEQEVETEKQSADALALLINTLNQNAENISRINTFLISRDGEAGFIKDIEDLALRSNVEFTTNSFNREELDGSKQYELSVLRGTASGDISDIYHFLMLLEAFPKKMVVTDVDLQSIGSPGGDNFWRLTFIAKALKEK